MISKVLWYSFEDIKRHFKDFQCCGDVMMAKIVSCCFSIGNKVSLINQDGEVCYRWRHMYYLQSFNSEELKQVKVKLESESISTLCQRINTMIPTLYYCLFVWAA